MRWRKNSLITLNDFILKPFIGHNANKTINNLNDTFIHIHSNKQTNKLQRSFATRASSV